jgi:hypothetical protein
MKYAIEVGSGAMTHISSFLKIGSGITNLFEEGIRISYRHTDSKMIS